MELFTPWHIVLVVIVGAVLYYSRGQLPDLAKSAGRSLRLFRTEMHGLADDVRGETKSADATSDRPGDAPTADAGRSAPPTLPRAQVITTAKSSRAATAPAARASTSRPSPRPSPSATRDRMRD